MLNHVNETPGPGIMHSKNSQVTSSPEKKKILKTSCLETSDSLPVIKGVEIVDFA